MTHSFELGPPSDGPRLEIRITDASSDKPLAARVSLSVDDQTFVPEWVDEHGIRFTSIHKSKGQRFTAIYSRGTGKLALSLPENARRVSVTATHGFEYLPAQGTVLVDGQRARLDLSLKRWTDLSQEGWIAIDEHLHYDRLDPSDDPKWLAMLEADGLSSAHFMLLKGGMVPGIWSKQFAFGEAGQANDGHRSIIPGQEYRDSAQGHINLLGIREPIEPYSTGGMGWPKIVENYPPLHDVLNQARSQGAFVGAAHGGSLGKHSTAIADAVLGTMNFWEISNGFIYSVDNWYRLMNCGYFLPPVAGTDLPNSPEREPWQPMLGSIRTYVQTNGQHDFESFKQGLVKGRVFITGGPILKLTVNGRHPGEIVNLPRAGTVSIRAELDSPRALRAFKLVHDGQALDSKIVKSSQNGINRWVIEQRLSIDRSGWIATWGKGASIKAQGGIDAMAHSNVVRVQIGDEPIQSPQDSAFFINELEQRRAFYQEKGAYKNDAQRKRAIELLDQAIAKLQEQ